jgi:glycosyltransferase involved in cell wall biosynthesis
VDFGFRFIKYINPVWYFNVGAKADAAYFPDYRLLSDAQKAIINYDAHYSCEEASLWDAAFQAFKKGIIITNADYKLKKDKSKQSLVDEYRFLRRNFHGFRILFTLLLRLLSLHNPFAELTAFLQSKENLQRPDMLAALQEYPDFFTFQSTLEKEQPFVSIILPTLNRYEYLAKVMEDLEKQLYKNFEVIVMDQSDVFDAAFFKQYKLNLQVEHLPVKGLWNARNNGLKKAKGEYIAFSEDDVRIEPDWLNKHLRCIEFFKCDISSGIFFPEGSTIPKSSSYFRWAEQFATGNAFAHRKVFEKCGLFDRQFEKQRMGDGEFGMRAYLNGFLSVSNPFAWCYDVKAPVGGLREMGSWDAFRPKKLFAPRPIPSVNYFVRKYFGNKMALIFNAQNVPSSYISYKFKRNKKMLIIGIFIFVLLLPLLLIPVVKSWRTSSRMLKEGAKIDQYGI